jgi:signal transduction histidine kinase
MRLRRPRSLLWRVLGVQLVCLALIWGALSGYTFYRAHDDTSTAIDGDLVLVANALARMVSVSPTPAAARSTAEHLRDLNMGQADPPLRADQFVYQVWRADGALLARSDERPALPAFAPGQLDEGRKWHREGWVLYAARSPDHQIVAVIGHAEKYYDSIGLDFLRQTVYGYLQLAVILTFLLWFTLRIGLKPLRVVSAQVSQRQQDDLTPVQVAKPYLELDTLVAALNDKLARVQSALKRERDFFADAAHELRTPLSAIAAQAHLIVAEREPAERERAAAALQSGVLRAARVLNRLLLVNRLDAAPGASAMEPVELSELAEDAVRDLQARADASGHRIGIAAEPIRQRADRESLYAALECLLDNALKYTPAGTQIIVSVHRDGAETVVAVRDNGPGIPPDQHERAFTRFERLGRTDQEGSGLGLAIVQRVAQLHGGQALLMNGVDGGCVVELRFPQQ